MTNLYNIYNMIQLYKSPAFFGYKGVEKPRFLSQGLEEGI